MNVVCVPASRSPHTVRAEGLPCIVQVLLKTARQALRVTVQFYLDLYLERVTFFEPLPPVRSLGRHRITDNFL